MWFLGAGASASAGIPTASDMIWDFKRRLFCSEQGKPRATVADTGNDAIRAKIQTYLDETHKYSAKGSEEEYSDYFEATFPSASDRRRYVQSLMEDASPSHGHVALAALVKSGKVQTVWTTNFDKLIEDACARILGSLSRFIVVDLGEPEKATQTLQRGTHPLIVKLHGDFHSVRLKNTEIELRKADEEMRSCLIDACASHGLAIVGYSGRDACVMEALEQSIASGRGFPGGLFWFKRSGDTLYKRVDRLIETAASKGIEAHVIELGTFDELLDGVIRFLPDLSEETMEIVKATAPILSSIPLRRPSKNVPIIRSNALPILSTPSICRLLKCEIGGPKEVSTAVEQSHLSVLAQRCSLGVLAFGRDSDIKKVFAPYEIAEFDTYAIQPDRLQSHTGEARLLFDALAYGLRRRTGMTVERRGARVFTLANKGIADRSVFNAKRAGTLRDLFGVIRDTGIEWTEACELKLDYRLDRLWLLIDPTVVILGNRELDQTQRAVAKEFVRQRTLTRYNQQYNSLLSGWIEVLLGDGQDPIKLVSLGIGDGIDASFEISRITGYSGVTAL